jgi:integrase
VRVGRKKKNNPHLPRGVTHEHSAYYFRGRDRKRVRLGAALGESMGRWAEIVQPHGGPVGTLHDAFERFKTEVVPHKAAKTRTGYLYMLPVLDAIYGKMAPRTIHPRHGYQLLDRGRRTPTQTLKLFNLMSSVLTSCVRWGAIDENPFWQVRKGDYTPPARTRCPTDAEYSAVYALASERLQIAMDLALLTGLRKGGILRLELADDTQEGLRSRRPGKTTKPLLFVWTPELRAVVDRAKRLEPRLRRALLCTGKAKNPRHKPGKAYTEDGFNALWQRLMTKATRTMDRDGNPITPTLAERFRLNDIRAKSATDAETVAEAQARLGHTTPATTERVYIRKPTKVQPLRRPATRGTEC